MNEYCQQHGFIGWYETSAKENKGIDDAAKALVKYILEHEDRRPVEEDPSIIRPTAEVEPDTKRESGGGCSC